MTTTQDAFAPANEAASSHLPAKPTAVQNGLEAATRSRLLTAAGDRLRALLDRFAAWCLNTFGPVEIILDGWFCANCNDVHRAEERCHRALVGRCEDCRRWRPLDRYGNCGTCGSRSVTHRRLMFARAMPKPET